MTHWVYLALIAGCSSIAQQRTEDVRKLEHQPVQLSAPLDVAIYVSLKKEVPQYWSMKVECDRGFSGELSPKNIADKTFETGALCKFRLEEFEIQGERFVRREEVKPKNPWDTETTKLVFTTAKKVMHLTPQAIAVRIGAKENRLYYLLTGLFDKHAN